jgi:hypothetical protein
LAHFPRFVTRRRPCLFFLHCSSPSPFTAEVKFEPEHMIEDTSHVEPITHETVKKLQKPMVEQQKGGKCNSTSN